MNSFCETKRLCRKGNRYYCYVLPEEFISKFKKESIDDEEFDFGAPDEYAREYTKPIVDSVPYYLLTLVQPL